MASLGLAVMTAASSVAVVSCAGAEEGGIVLQVLNLLTGADVTASFDRYMPETGYIVQLDSAPAQGAAHIVAFQRAGGTDVVGVKLALVTPIGGRSLPGPASAPGVHAGDTILSALYPVMRSGVSMPVDYSLSFAPTVVNPGVVTQITATATDDLVVLLLRNAGAADQHLGLGVASNESPGTVTVVGVDALDQILTAISPTSASVVTGNYLRAASGAGALTQVPGSPTDGSVVLFLLQRSA